MNFKEICCIGAGYVGGPTMAVIAFNCPNYKITIVDSNESRINQWNGPLDNLPIYEPGLKEIISDVRGKNLFFSNKIEKSIKNSEIIFIAVNTPTKTHGEGKGMAADLTNIQKCAELIASSSTSDKIIVEKSTAPVGTGEKIKSVLKSINPKIKFQIVSNPEFLAEGTAINDLMNPDRVLIGGEKSDEGEKAVNTIANIYREWLPTSKIILTNLWSSELSKLASNAFLAQRISSINSLSALCEKTGAKIDEVSKSVGMDTRIGSKFLQSSVGFGGSCFKKDILNLVYLCKYLDLPEVGEYWENVLKINEYQKERFCNKIINTLNYIKNPTVSIFGWAFKKNTNDSRESASIDITEKLLNNNYNVNVYDPMVSKITIIEDLKDVSNENLKKLKICSSVELSAKNSHAICILTEWDEFKTYNYKYLSSLMQEPILFIDGRNILSKDKLNGIFKNNMSIDS
ncbi:nucleotide sugar dehydrogenase [Flavobacteriaceae bacterium]|nr:nucleotide sugar dehydrogenase [Flavobacteriaceae bacterium]